MSSPKSSLLPWVVKLPANASSVMDFPLAIGPHFKGVSAIHCCGWRISATSMPAEVKIVFDGDVGQVASGFFSLAVANGTATALGRINNGLLFSPNTTLQFDSQDYQLPRLIAYTGAEGVGAITARVTDFSGAAISWSGYIVLEMMLTIDNTKHAYATDLNEMQRAALDGYFIESGKRNRRR